MGRISGSNLTARERRLRSARRTSLHLLVALAVTFGSAACAGTPAEDPGGEDDAAAAPSDVAASDSAPEPTDDETEAQESEDSEESPDDTSGDDEAAAADDHGADDAEASAQAAVDAVASEEITGSTSPSAAEDGDIVFAPCLGDDDFDLDTLDDVTASSFDADVEAANGQQGSLEVRAFDDAATAAEAYTALEVVLGTPEGRECFASQVAASLGGAEAPEIEAYSAGGIELGIRLTANFGGQPFFIDYLAAQSGGCTFLGSFQGRGEPFDADIAAAMFDAALP